MLSRIMLDYSSVESWTLGRLAIVLQGNVVLIGY